MPRPTKQTATAEKKILQALKDGNVRSTAAALAGIGKTTFYEWMASNTAFSNAVLKAEAEAEAVRVARIRKAGDEGNWQADAWWLERRRHEAWGRKDVLEKALGRMTNDELRAFIEGLHPELGPAGANGVGAPAATIAEHATSDSEP